MNRRTVFLGVVASLIILTLRPVAAETAHAYPRWDGQEQIADYARRASLQPQQSIDLGGGIKLELKLVPAGRFEMGTPSPFTMDIMAFRWPLSIALGAILLAAAAVLWHKRSGRKFSIVLALLLASIMTPASGACWYLTRKQLRAQEEQKMEFKQIAECEKPAHSVIISTPFYMSIYEVTQEQYAAVKSANPSTFKGARNPVEEVSWKDAVQFCEKVNLKLKINIDLPTEAQWEYACRAGTTTSFNTGESLDKSKANIDSPETMPVGKFKPNAFGLYDLHGNVWEWCKDLYGENYYSQSPQMDPPGPAKSDFDADARVLRGGSWGGDPDFYRSASRRWVNADDRNNDIGFRIILPLAPQR
jgi:formylglycine-generating enzyme required for sulfatase activity